MKWNENPQHKGCEIFENRFTAVPLILDQNMIMFSCFIEIILLCGLVIRDTSQPNFS